MTAPLLLPALGDPALAARLGPLLGAEAGPVLVRRFPDEESYLRLEVDPAGRDVVVLADLARPDGRTLPALFLCEAARDLGARRVLLVAPYLPYMRQDARFRPGEAVTSVTYARLLSRSIDGLVTVDPHLHRHPSLDAVYTVPARVVHAAPALAAWIAREVERPLVVGPDAESEQWARDVAARAGAPHVVLAKERRGDREVALTLPDLSPWRGRTPVLVDDIASTARTLIEAVGGLRAAGLPPPVCLVVHPLFAGDAWERLRAAGPARVVSCGTVPHPSAAIDLAPDLAAATRSLLA